MKCLDDQQLQHHFAGTLPPDEREVVNEHLGQCGVCAELVAAVAVESTTAPGTGDPRESWRPGQLIDRYVLEELIGRGASSAVFRAYDPKLKRNVALKLMAPREIDGSGSRSVAQRMAREAEALAKLAHPNVVSVFDAGTVDDEVYVAMELVDGMTLRLWLTNASRTWRSTLEILLQIARGLAAAHARNLVHRDLKPDNVMIGADGRARVVDFGLVGLGGRPPDDDGDDGDDDDDHDHDAGRRPPAPHRAVDLTRTGTVLGTPAYMAPEQLAGKPANELADQFSFCVVAFEALCGKRPVPGGATPAASRVQGDGQMTLPPDSRRLPRWLRRILRRGLSSRPADRFPSMAALIAELERGRARAPKLVFAAAAALALGGAGLLSLAQGEDASCERVGDSVANVWSPARGVALQRTYAALVAPGPGRDVTRRVARQASNHAQRWRKARRDVCHATRVTETQSVELMDRRMACLDGNLRQLGASLSLIEDASDAGAFYSAVRAVFALPSPDQCVDSEYIVLGPPRPADPNALRELESLEAKLDRLEVELSTRLDRRRAQPTEQLLFDAERIGYLPATVRARLTHSLLLERTDKERALDLLRASLVEAASSRDITLEARAAARALRLIGGLQGRVAAAEQVLPFVLAIRARLDAPHWQATLDARLADFHNAAGRYEQALAYAERAATGFEARGWPARVHLAQALSFSGKALRQLGRHAEARTVLIQSLDLARATMGEAHPSTGYVYNELGLVAMGAGSYDDAARWFAKERDNYELCFGVGSSVAENNLGMVAFDRSDFHAALVHYERAAALARELEEGPSSLARALNNIATVYHVPGDHERAQRYYERALEQKRDALGPDHPALASTLVNLGFIAILNDDAATAEQHCGRALALWEAALPPNHVNLSHALSCLGQALLLSRRHDEALAFLERALTIHERQTVPEPDRAELEFALARALWHGKGSRKRALALAESARSRYRTAGTAYAGQLAAVNDAFGRFLPAPTPD